MKMNNAHKIGTVAAVIACAACVETMGASTVIRDFFDETISLVPNQLDVAVFEKVIYTDNVKNGPHNDMIEAVHFKTGVAIDAYRNQGDLSYGIKGSVAYDYYTRRSGDMNQWDWDITPFIKGSSILDIHNLKISASVKNSIEAMSNADTRYARHHIIGAGASYDYSRYDRWGVMLNGAYKYDYYPQDEFNDYSKQRYTASIAPYYRARADFKTGIRAQYEKIVYESDKRQNDSQKQTYNVFVDYRINSFIEAYAEAGIEKKAYKGEAKGTNEDREWNWDALASIRYYPTLRTKIELKTELDVEDSTAGTRGAAFAWDNSLAFSWKPETRYLFTTKIGAETQDEKNNRADSTEYYISVRGNFAVNEHLNLFAQYKYDNVDFKYISRDYYENEVTLGVSYKF